MICPHDSAMAETVSLCLSYITESSNESLKSFDSGAAADDAINLLRTKATNGSVEALDVSYRSPVQLIEIFSSISTNKQDQTTKMDERALKREIKKAWSVTSSHSFEKGESSGTHSSTPKSTEVVKETNSVGDGNQNVVAPPRSSQVTQENFLHGDLGTDEDVELEMLIKRAFRLPLTDGLELTRLTVAETQYTNKGKEPVRPSVADTSSFDLGAAQNDKETLQNNNDSIKLPLRSALKKKSVSSTRLAAQRSSSTRSQESDQSTAKMMVQFESHKVENGLHTSEGAIEPDGTWDINQNHSDDNNSQTYTSDDDDQERDDEDWKEMLENFRKNAPASAITVRPYTSPLTGEDVFLFNHGIVIPRKDTSKLVYGVAIPGKILRQKEKRWSSTFEFLVTLSKANLDTLEIETANADMIRMLILDDAEESYRKSRYGDYTWIGILKERKRRFDPDTQSRLSIFYPSQWRRHGLVLSEGQNPPENSCKFRMMTLCGKVLHQWYVRCDARKGFEPRNLIARISCGGDGKCEKSLTWEPESGPKAHSDSVKRWTEIDPDREGVGLPDLFYPFMKLWIIEGPPREEPPLACMKINCVTRCGLVKSKIRLLCPRHISKNPKCVGGEFTMLIDRGCALRDDINRCDEKTACEGYIAWVDARLGLPLESLTVKQANDLDRLHTTLVSAYRRETRYMGSFLKHRDSEKKWRDVIYNHVEFYEMLYNWGLRTIQYPKDLRVVPVQTEDFPPES